MGVNDGIQDFPIVDPEVISALSKFCKNKCKVTRISGTYRNSGDRQISL